MTRPSRYSWLIDLVYDLVDAALVAFIVCGLIVYVVAS